MKKKLIYFVVVVIYIILFNGISNYSDLRSTFLSVLLFVVYFGCFFGIDYLLSENNEGILSENIIRKMSEEGYQCEKDHGELSFMMHGIPFHACLLKTHHHLFKVKIYAGGRIMKWNEVSQEFKTAFAYKINLEYPRIKAIVNDKGIWLSYSTAISGSDDFIQAAEESYSALSEPVSIAREIIRKIYAENERYQIGESELYEFEDDTTEILSKKWNEEGEKNKPSFMTKLYGAVIIIEIIRQLLFS